MVRVTLRRHQHRLAQPSPERHEEPTQKVQLFLPLQLPQIDIEVDRVLRQDSEDRQHIRSGPDAQVRAVGI